MASANRQAYYRRGLSRLAILRPTEAVLDFKKCLSIDPKNADVRRQLDTTVKLIRRIEFEKVRHNLRQVLGPC